MRSNRDVELVISPCIHQKFTSHKKSLGRPWLYRHRDITINRVNFLHFTRYIHLKTWLLSYETNHKQN